MNNKFTVDELSNIITDIIRHQEKTSAQKIHETILQLTGQENAWNPEPRLGQVLDHLIHLENRGLIIESGWSGPLFKINPRAYEGMFRRSTYFEQIQRL